MASRIQPASIRTSDVLIAGAGIIGLSLAFELRQRGAAVTVVDRRQALGGASIAAAGMLAAEDPHNPPALLPLSRHSLALYPAFLERVQALSGQAVPRQTSVTVQYAAEGAYRIPEHSIDPRQLAAALLAAAHASGVHIAEHAEIADLEISSSEVNLRTSNAQRFAARSVVHATGAWLPITSPALELPIVPRKGQMLRVAVPADKPLHEVHRAGHVYIVPRTAGPQAGTALIGATVEDAGFDISTHPGALQQLRVAAAALAPQTAFAAEAPLLESWAGLRPSTPDFLPVIGRLRERELIATGHFRNGILLAPGTAHILAELLSGNSSPVDLAPFAPGRFNPGRFTAMASRP